MRYLGIISAVMCLFVFAAPSGAEERVEGAGLIKEGATVQEITPAIMGLPFDQAEVDLLLGSLDAIEQWAIQNIKEWNDVETSKDVLSAVRALGVWEASGITAGEYFAIFAKLSTARDIHDDKYDTEQFKKQVRDVEDLLKGSLPEDSKKQLEDSAKMLSAMIEAIEKYPAANLEVYKANKDAVDAAFARVRSLSLRAMIGEGNGKRVKELLSLGADVNAASANGYTPLMIAASKGDKEIVDILLEAGADLHAKSQYGYTALSSAITKGNKEVAERLIEAGADVNAKDGSGRTLLMSAVYDGDNEIVDMLIKAGADVNAKGKYGDTALKSAVDKGRREIAEMLIKAGADVNETDKYGNSILMNAIDLGKREVAEMLLSLGADIDFRNARGETALISACSLGDKDKIKLLLEMGADVNVKDKYDNTPLHIIIQRPDPDPEIVKLLLDAGAFIDARDKYGQTALMRAAAKITGDMQIAKLLIREGANLNVRDGNGLTVLIQSVMDSHKEMVEVLLSAGADVNATSAKGYTPLQYARNRERHDPVAREIAGLLMQYGAR